MYPRIETLTDSLHDHLCRCGERCFGWQEDFIDIQAYIEDRFGSTGVLESALEKMSERHA